eukprot:gb/GEZN01025678.1/.p1 GENE.gb/GEZN01025678.1/~~gb/GEZN01025678.1/.p1  ORF type:complete len:160 (+),score=9.76 gb/GEZN01025678.1/:34-513(+)
MITVVHKIHAFRVGSDGAAYVAVNEHPDVFLPLAQLDISATVRHPYNGFPANWSTVPPNIIYRYNNVNENKTKEIKWHEVWEQPGSSRKRRQRPAPTAAVALPTEPPLKKRKAKKTGKPGSAGLRLRYVRASWTRMSVPHLCSCDQTSWCRLCLFIMQA